MKKQVTGFLGAGMKKRWLMFEECVYCEGVADFIQIDGGWYVCAGCIKEGQTDTQAQEMAVTS